MSQTIFRPAVVTDVDALPLFLTVEQTADLLGLGRTAAYEAARRGQIPTVRFGRKYRVPRAALLNLGLPEGGGDDAA